ncbi:MAG: polyprenol monophosphomannose synthase [Chloroflexota bacterium]
MKATVVIPTYNERDNLEAIVNEVLGLGEEYHVLIVDDNSPDGTGELADELVSRSSRVEVIHRPQKQGLGTAYCTGFKHALENRSDYIIEMDADFSHDPHRLPDFLAMMGDYDLVIGSRYAKGIAVVNWSIKRLVLSLSANLYARWITGLSLSDCTSGFKCFSRKVLESIDVERVFSNGYAFQVEMNYRAQRQGYRLGELPIIFVDRKVGQSKMSTKIARDAFWHIFRMRATSLIRPVSFARIQISNPNSTLLAATPGSEPQQPMDSTR